MACSCSLPFSHHNIMLVQQIKEGHQVYLLCVAFLVKVAEQLAEGVLSLLLGLLAQARQDPVLATRSASLQSIFSRKCSAKS